MYNGASEYDECRALYRWLSACGVEIAHVPNGDRRDARTGARLRSIGVRAGLPDYIVLSPSDSGVRVWIEMKRRDGGRVSKAQREMIALLASVGDVVIVAKGARDAIDQLAPLYDRVRAKLADARNRMV